MKPDDQTKFLVWFEQQEKSVGYDLEKEMLAYCIDDEKVLIGSIGALRDEFKAITSLDPTSRHFTLASIGMETFRALHLPRHTLARTPTAGYAPVKVSMVCEAWLDAWEDKIGHSIHREFPLGRYQADGVCLETKTIFEYNGCHWHGCPCTHKDANKVLSERDGKTVKQVREYDDRKMRFYKNTLGEEGFKVVLARDCDNSLKAETEIQLKRIRDK